MRSRVYVTVERPSICLCCRSTAATAAGWFAAEHPAAGNRSPASGAMLMRRRSAANADSLTLTAVRGG